MPGKLQRVLGIDLGAQSVGWALLEFEGDDARRIVATGVRVFETGTLEDIERGRDEPPGAARRQARQQRRQTERRARRMRKTAYVLQAAGLLPEGGLRSGHERDALLKHLDEEIRRVHAAEEITLLPYYLRARALDAPLSPHELGRALYHLAHRRGFLSNRKAAKADEDTGKVKQDIAQLSADMRERGSRTLGEYLASVDPIEERRLRKRWTARHMYLDEFEAIWDAQSPHHPDILTPALKDNLYDAIFDQRPLKSQKGLVGKCELEPGEKRAPMALLPAQRFRYLQRINDLRVCLPDGVVRELTVQERDLLAAHFEQHEEVTFGGLRRLLKVPKGTEFNLERGGEKKLPGNKTAARLRKVFGDRWDTLSSTEQQAVIGELLGVTSEDTMYRRGREVWGLDEENARLLANTQLESGYIALSKKALKKIVPLLEQGMPFITARDDAYNDNWTRNVCDALPSVDHANLGIRNPIVTRTLTEMRKVVNGIIRAHGKPDLIRVELARELKKSREQRKNIWTENRKREAERLKAAERIMKNTQITDPSRLDIQKVLLADECEWTCPYTGKTIGWSALLGDTPQFDIEHIIPFSRSLDDSFLNKTLCEHEENRSVKRNRTPFEAYSGTPNWDEMLTRVAKFKGDAARPKLERFRLESTKDLDEFASQKLNDTRYASRLASQYLGWLYGEEARTRIQVSTGQITAYLRNAWQMNGILGDGGEKSRDDHRHHAVDAIAIALVSRKMVHGLANAAKQREQTRGRSRGWWKEVPVPWDTFLEDAQAAVGAIAVSHRVNHRVRGQLHKDKIYTAPRKDGNGKTYVAIRKPLDGDFNAAAIENIIDPAVRAAVRECLDRHGGDAKKAFGDAQSHPFLVSGSGRRIPIHKVRIRCNRNLMRVGSGHRERYVDSGANQHMEILEVEKNGKKKWEGVIVSRFEAMQRLRNGEPVVRRDHGPGKCFVCTLAPGDVVKLTVEDGCGLWRVRSVSEGRVELAHVRDSRKKDDIRKSGDWLKPTVNSLSEKLRCHKVTISPIGEVVYAHD